MTQQTVSLSGSSQAQLRQGRIVRGVRSVIRHLVLALLAGIWLVPIVWLVATSFSTDRASMCGGFSPLVIHWTTTPTSCSTPIPLRSSRAGL